MTCTPNNNFELYLRFADERGLGGACWPATSTFRSAVQKETQIGGQEVRALSQQCDRRSRGQKHSHNSVESTTEEFDF